MAPKRVRFGGANDHEAKTSNSKGKEKTPLIEEPEKIRVIDQILGDSRSNEEEILEAQEIVKDTYTAQELQGEQVNSPVKEVLAASEVEKEKSPLKDTVEVREIEEVQLTPAAVTSQVAAHQPKDTSSELFDDVNDCAQQMMALTEKMRLAPVERATRARDLDQVVDALQGELEDHLNAIEDLQAQIKSLKEEAVAHQQIKENQVNEIIEIAALLKQMTKAKPSLCMSNLPSASALWLQGTLAHSSTRLSCFRLQQAFTEADYRGVKKTKAQQELHGASRRPNVLKDTLLDEEANKKFMGEALCEARKAAASGEVPVGAVLVSQGRVVARAFNRVEKENDPTAHAEMVCTRNTARRLGGWRLLNSILYVTLEPCPMCAGALLQARVGAVVWGAQNSLLGADGSWVSLFPKHSLAVDSEEQLLDSEMSGAPKKGGLVHPFNPDIKGYQ
ncbi:hypothetical protein L7F22_040743 [Adiantum nelumboides]|nr:hypothetical protein [Adiantum nelumboides]